ncbi:MAG: hypothetical protein J6D37_06215 [Clostridia bacterium]|nr:hypothetical protein [Clostridia bacterium]
MSEQEKSRTEEFLDVAVEGISDKRQKRQVRDELEDHIMEKKEEFRRRGYSDEDAEKKAVDEMGNKYDLSEQMSKLHSFLPHVYYQRSVLFLFFGLLFSHFDLEIGSFNLFPDVIGILFVTIALFRFYALSIKTKTAFWLYTVSQLIFGFVKPLSSEFASLGALILPIAMTLLCLTLHEKERENPALGWVIGIEWGYVLLFLLALTKLEILFVPSFVAIISLLIAELILVGKFARRAVNYEWATRRGLHPVILISLVIVYVVSFYVIPLCIDLRLMNWSPDGRVWTERREELIVANGATWEDMALSPNGASTKVNFVQQYMAEEDYEILVSLDGHWERGRGYSSSTSDLFSVYAQGEDTFYVIVFFYHTFDAEGKVCRQELSIKTGEAESRYRYFYTDDKGTYTYGEGEYFYVLQGRESFGYAILEGKGKNFFAPLELSYTLQTHAPDLFNLGRTNFEDGWEKAFSIG